MFSMTKVNGEYPTKTWDFNHNYDQCWKTQIGVKFLSRRDIIFRDIQRYL